MNLTSRCAETKLAGWKCCRIPAGLFLLVLAACTSQPPDSDTIAESPEDSLSLERTRCYGFCKAYRVLLARDGRVRFESLSPPDSGHTATAAVTASAVDSLFRAVNALALDSLPAELQGQAPYCHLAATDHSYVIVTVYGPAGRRSVRDYLGCFEQNDESGRQVIRRLRAFEQAVDSVAGSSRWIVELNQR